MEQLSSLDCEQVGAGSVAALLGLAVQIIGGAGAIREFADGLFDGFGGL